MKIIAIYGGPRLNKNTDKMLNLYLNNINKNLNDVERIDLKDLSISMCNACYYCAKHAKCIIDDDMQKIYEKLDSSDMIILATPMFFNSVSSLTKVMIDRCQMYWSKKFLLKDRNNIKEKKGILLITTGAIQKNKEIPGASLVVDLFFKSVDAVFSETVLIDNTDNISFENQNEKIEELIISAKRI